MVSGWRFRSESAWLARKRASSSQTEPASLTVGTLLAAGHCCCRWVSCSLSKHLTLACRPRSSLPASSRTKSRRRRCHGSSLRGRTVGRDRRPRKWAGGCRGTVDLSSPSGNRWRQVCIPIRLRPDWRHRRIGLKGPPRLSWALLTNAKKSREKVQVFC